MKREHLFELDFVRVLAAVMIVVFHYNMVSIGYPEIRKPVLLFLKYANGTMGHIGVSLFFILTGVSLMYTYGDGLELRTYLKKRFLAVYPLYWTVYGAFFIYFFLITKKLSFELPLWRFLLTVIGMDGYLDYMIPNYYLVGEWFVGCIVLIYLLFPVLRYSVIRWPGVTAAVAAVGYILLVWFYPFKMDIQFFFLIRVPEVLAGMYFVRYLYGTKEQRGRFGWKWGMGSLAVLLMALTVRTGLAVPFKILWTGVPCFLFLVWVGRFVTNGAVRKAVSVFSGYTFAVFLVHHILVGKFLFPFSGKTIGVWQNYFIFTVYFLFSCTAAVAFLWVSRILVRIFGAAGLYARRHVFNLFT